MPTALTITMLAAAAIFLLICPPVSAIIASVAVALELLLFIVSGLDDT